MDVCVSHLVFRIPSLYRCKPAARHWVEDRQVGGGGKLTLGCKMLALEFAVPAQWRRVGPRGTTIRPPLELKAETNLTGFLVALAHELSAWFLSRQSSDKINCTPRSSGAIFGIMLSGHTVMLSAALLGAVNE